MKSIWSHSDYRDLLKETFAERNLKNPSYSLRAFSRDIRLDPGRLSKVLSGTEGLSREAAKAVAQYLGYRSDEVDFFADLVESEHARTAIRRKVAAQRLESTRYKKSLQEVQLDCFAAIENWYHFAILELTLCRGFKSDAHWIAKRLGISLETASDAIERLLRLDLLKRTSKGLANTNDHHKVGHQIPSSAIRNFHRQLLQKAADSLESQPVDRREFGSLMLAVDPTQIPLAKNLIQGFCKDFGLAMAAAKRKTEVFCLSVQFYNLTHSPEKHGK
jgi:uncharacterized protein (TIGR02147 family)